MTNVGRFRFGLGLAIAAALTFLSQKAAAEERVVNFYNWSNYMAPDVLEAFTKETGIKVVYDTFDANETLETRLMAGKSGYDVVVPTAYFLQRQIKANVFARSITVVEEAEATTLGAALLAGVAAGVYPTFDAAWRGVERKEYLVEPEPEAVERYEKLRISVMAEIPTQLRPINNAIAKFAAG